VNEAAEVVDLAQVIVSEEIRRILRERWSGVLAMTQGEVTKGLYFVEGEISFAASTVEEDRLGANLFRIGRITEAQFRAALSSAQEPGRRIGQALIEAGVLTPVDLAMAVTGQVERIVLSVLRWTSGVLQRRTMDRPIPADLALDLNTPRLLLLGARLFPDVERLEGALGGPATRLRKVVPRPFSYDMLEPSPGERAVLAMCSRETALGDLFSLPHPRPRIVRSVYALVAGGMLEHLPAPAVAAAQFTTSAAVRPVVTPAPPPEPEPAPRAAPPPVSPPPRSREAPVPPAPPTPTRPVPRPTPSPPSASEDEPPSLTLDPMREPHALPEWAMPADPDSSTARAASAPPDPNTAESRARGLLERGLRGAAVELLTETMTRHPEATSCQRLLAMTLAHAPGFREDVEKHFLAVLEQRSDDVELRHRLATYYRRAGMTARAILQLRLVLKADPSHAAAWRDLGELEAGEGKRRGR